MMVNVILRSEARKNLVFVETNSAIEATSFFAYATLWLRMTIH